MTGPTPTTQLSPTDLRVLALVADGLTHQAIGHRIGTTKGAVRQRLFRLYRQIGAANAANAVAIAYRTGQLRTNEVTIR